MAARDPYVVLGVGPEATYEEIKAAYRRRVKETHPDAHPGDPHAAGRFRAATAAWERIQRERGARAEPHYEPPPAYSSATADSASNRFVRQAVATGVTAAEAAVEKAANRLTEKGGLWAVLGEALRGAAGGLAHGAERVMSGDEASPTGGHRREPREPRR